ncbi:MAG: hypothetical protein NTX49_02980 [Chlamydiae bacterium]|nr:hypothetical protein [Chlamydiota bacterium]
MFAFFITVFLTIASSGFCNTTLNQTDDLSPVLSPDSLPYEISIELANFQLPSDPLNDFGLQSFIHAEYKGKWLLLAGRTSGLHGFPAGQIPPAFPIVNQNTLVYVVDPSNGSVIVRDLLESSSKLTQGQIDTLSVTSPQYYQSGNTLYLIGGYGIDTSTGQYSTKSTLTAIDVPGLIHWVETGNPKKSAARCIRQTSHPLLQVTGGFLTKINSHGPYLLVFGQNFPGYYTPISNGFYTQQVRNFQIVDNGNTLYILPGKQQAPNPNYRRRDLNVIPIIQRGSTSYDSGAVVLSGVFTEAGGIWTVPVLINGDGSSFMPDPSNPNTFKQGMNNYSSAHLGLFSKKTGDMFMLLFGGMSYLLPDQTTNAEIPFVNTVTTVKIDAQGNMGQYLMGNTYPVINSVVVNPGNVLLFGAEARFIPESNIPSFANGVISLDSLGSTRTLLGYIVGGIQSTLPNTNNQGDSAASPYIFSVFLQKK